MSRSYKIIGFLLVTLRRQYGCAKGPAKVMANNSPAARVQNSRPITSRRSRHATNSG